MKIFLITNGVPTKEYPLLGIFEFDQAQALASAGHDVTVLGIDLRSFLRKRKLGIVSGEKGLVKWYTISLPVGAVPISILCFIGTQALKFLYKRAFKNHGKPDILHAHFTEIGYMAAGLSEEEKIPLVITEHSSKINRENVNNSLKKYALSAYKRANKIIAVSNALSNNIYLNFKIHCKVIPNIVSLKEFYFRREHHEGFGFISTANLVPIKCHHLLIQAFNKVHEIHKDTFLGIVGDGELRKELGKLVDALGLNDSVIFYGQLSREKIAKLYAKYDCFVLPSASETFGVAYIEAMVCGLPVIATKCGGPEDFVISSVGQVVPVENETALKEAMCYVCEHYTIYNLKEISRYAKEKFSAHEIAKQLTVEYEEILYRN